MAPRNKKRSPREHGITVRWSAIAVADLIAITTYIERTSMRAARNFVNQARAKAALLSDFPRRGRVVPELGHLGITEWRELILSPYRLVYTVDDDIVEIDALLDARRDIEDLLLERLVRSNPKC